MSCLPSCVNSQETEEQRYDVCLVLAQGPIAGKGKERKTCAKIAFPVFLLVIF